MIAKYILPDQQTARQGSLLQTQPWQYQKCLRAYKRHTRPQA